MSPLALLLPQLPLPFHSTSGAPEQCSNQSQISPLAKAVKAATEAVKTAVADQDRHCDLHLSIAILTNEYINYSVCCLPIAMACLLIARE